MTEPPFSPTRRRLIASSAAALALTTQVGSAVAQVTPGASIVAEDAAIRPYHIAVPEAAHVNMPATVPADVAKALNSGEPAPSGLTDVEMAAFNSLNELYKKGGGYAAMMVTRPQTVGYGLADSPAGQAAWIYDKFAAWTYTNGEPERELSKDDMLDDITLYWLTNTATSSAQLYWENNNNNFNAVNQKTADISIPVAVTVFPGEIYRAPRSWTQKAYRNLIYFHEVDQCGHFAAWEQPRLFAEEIRAAFKPLRQQKYSLAN